MYFLSLVFPSHFIHLLYPVALTSMYLLKSSPLCFCSLGGTMRKTYIDPEVREKISQLELRRDPFSGVPKLTYFYCLSQYRLCLPITDRELARTIYLLKINNPLLQTLQGFPNPFQGGNTEK